MAREAGAILGRKYVAGEVRVPPRRAVIEPYIPALSLIRARAVH